MIADRPLLGIVLMLGFCVLAPLGDSVAKILGGTVPLGEMVLVRFAIQALLLIPLVAVTGRIWRMRGRVLGLAFVRTLLHIAAMGTMYTALRYLPVADAVAIAFVLPFFNLILGHFVLGEEIGARRIIACIVGFLGVLMVIQPSFVEAGWPALLPLAVALGFSLFMLVTRAIARQTDPIGLQAVNGIMALAVLVPLLLATRGSGLPALALKVPALEEALLLLAIGVIGTCAHLLMTWSLRFAPSATLAPMQYLEIPFATLFGWMIFRDLPGGLAAAGIAVTIGAGLYVVLRERAILRRPAPQVP